MTSPRKVLHGDGVMEAEGRVHEEKSGSAASIADWSSEVRLC